MERRNSVIRKSEHFVWHSRKTLSPHALYGIGLSSEMARDLSQQKQTEADKTIFEIMTTYPLKKVHKLEAMHKRGEK